MFKRVKSAIKKFFAPPVGSPRWAYIFPFLVLAVLIIGVFAGGAYGWEYANSPKFCGTTCHTMPPQDVTYKLSPHANVYCSECHIGRASIGQQFARKAQDIRELYSMIFHTYEFPITASRSRPARQTCEECHAPETFSDDSLRVITHFSNDETSTPSNTYLVMHTGGGSERIGLGRGIHWHIENPVYYFATDAARQEIPYVRVVNEDGTYNEYVDIESGFDPATIDKSQLVEMDCITCHNRVTHEFAAPQESVDQAMTQGLIDADIPQIHRQAVRVLSGDYATQDEAMQGIASLTTFYRTNFPDYANSNPEKIEQAISVLQEAYNRSVFFDQAVDWNTHPNNLGHITAPGCFRCHDGAHLDTDQQAIRLECNLCHSVPVVASNQDFVARIEISRGPEPESHLNPNWISLHNEVYDGTCTSCHTTGDAGGTSNTSFCSNSACHGNVYTYAGFDAPALHEALQGQLPTPEPTLAPVSGVPTFTANIGPIFAIRCVVCHKATDPTAGLNLTSYAGVMAGSTDAQVIVSGNATGSLLVQIQQEQHFANLSAAELDLVRQWIDAGAPEK
jgi:nitrate/TMAO reductase-like tetraheme cytochrome c subunit